MTREPIFVTGMGVVSPLGKDISTFWQNLRDGVSGVRPIDTFALGAARCRVAGLLEGYVAEEHFSRGDLRAMEPFAQYGVLAARQAWSQAQGERFDPARVAVITGTGIGGIVSYKHAYDALYAAETETKINAFTIPRMMNNALSGHIALQLGVKGRNLVLNSACSSGANAIGLATEWLREGLYDAVICGGAEAPVTYELLRTWEAMGVLSRSEEAPERVCKPFDERRDGFVLSEGAAMLVLERQGARPSPPAPLAEVVGFGANCDATSLTSPDVEGVQQAMQLALIDAQLTPAQVDCINLHGTGTKRNDLVESEAIAALFGTDTPSAVANKSNTGHTMGAASALEAVASVLSLQHQLVPPTLNWDHPDPACHITSLATTARTQSLRYVLSNSFAFGGSNACLVFGACL
jgi:3-oxoacyl-[acyl-carrier-protein] synthase II